MRTTSNFFYYDFKYQHYFKTFKTSLKEHSLILIISLTFFIASYLVVNTYYAAMQEDILLMVLVRIYKAFFFGGTVLSIYIAKRLIMERPKTSPLLYCYHILRDDVFTPDNIWRIVFAVLGLAIVISSFLTVKASIPQIVPFTYDAAFETLDRSLHFGHQPWELLQPLLGFEWVTVAIHRAYYFWFPAIFLTYYWQAGTREDKVLRMQFLLSFLCCWIVLGSFAATLLSSAGPIYFDRVVTDAPETYAPAMQYLLEIHQKHDLYMFHIKEYLWQFYQHPIEDGAIKGISAMPSMHVSIAFLMALFGARKGLFFGVCYGAFALLITLGSIHLLWHYAIDGYMSLFGTGLIWILCGKISRSIYAQSNT